MNFVLFGILILFTLFLTSTKEAYTNDYLNYLEIVHKAQRKKCFDTAHKNVFYCQPTFYSINKVYNS